jgi:DNA-directed RNA polymerase specialized sigma subunit
MGTEHTQMLDTVANALGMTVDELQAELQAGKTIPQIAKEKGIDLTQLQSTMQAEHAAGGMAGGMGMGGHGSMAGGHGQAQETIANALGLTVEELQAELQAGKTVPQIAQEKGVDLATIHEGMMAGR